MRESSGSQISGTGLEKWATDGPQDMEHLGAAARGLIAEAIEGTREP